MSTQPALGPDFEPAHGRTLRQAREALRAELDAGTTCPCCDRYARRYRRALHAGMAAALVVLYRHARSGAAGGWVSTKELRRYTGGGGDYAKLALWQLAEKARGPKGRRLGKMRATERGLAFASGSVSVRRVVIEYDGTAAGFEGPAVWIRDVLGSRFNYDELMEGSP